MSTITSGEVDQTLRRWTTAERDGDTAALDELLAEQFHGIGPMGFVLDKQQWIARHQPGGMVYDEVTWETASVAGHGDTAIVIGAYGQRATFQGEPAPTGPFRATQVLVRDGESVKIAHIQL